MHKYDWEAEEKTPLKENKKDERMRKPVNVTLHPEEIKRLDEIRKKRGYSRSMMIGKLILEYKD